MGTLGYHATAAPSNKNTVVGAGRDPGPKLYPFSEAGGRPQKPHSAVNWDVAVRVGVRVGVLVSLGV